MARLALLHIPHPWDAQSGSLAAYTCHRPCTVFSEPPTCLRKLSDYAARESAGHPCMFQSSAGTHHSKSTATLTGVHREHAVEDDKSIAAAPDMHLTEIVTHMGHCNHQTKMETHMIAPAR
jgi:hypothetical protein